MKRFCNDLYCPNRDMFRQTILLIVNDCNYTEIETKLKEEEMEETRMVEGESRRWGT